MKRIVALLLAGVMVIMAAGCSKPADQGAQASGDAAKADEVVELDFLGWEASPLETEAVKNGIAAFEATHPNIKINYTASLSGSEYVAKVLASAASKSLPDVIFCDGYDYPTMASKGILLDITDKFGSEFSMDEFIPASQQIMSFNDRVYGIHACIVGGVIFYNKDIFDAAGIPYPSSDPDNRWTVDEFVEIAKKLKTDDVWGCYGFEGSSDCWCALQASNNGRWFSDDAKSADFDTPQNKEVFQWIKDLRTVHNVAPTPATLDNAGMSAVQMLETGKIAMLADGSWCLQEIAASGMNVGIAPLPYFETPASAGEAHLHCITTQCEHPDEAWEFVKFLAGEEYQGAVCKTGLWMPNRSQWYKAENFDKWYDEKVYGAEFKTMAPYFEKSVRSEQTRQLDTRSVDVITEELNMFFLEDQDIDLTFSNIQNRINANLQEVVGK